MGYFKDRIRKSEKEDRAEVSKTDDPTRSGKRVSVGFDGWSWVARASSSKTAVRLKGVPHASLDQIGFPDA